MPCLPVLQGGLLAQGCLISYTVRRLLRGEPLSVFKRGNIYWYKFTWGGKRIQESTRQSNYRAAVNIENDAKTKLAQGNAGIRIKKDAGTLADYLTNHLKPWAEAQFAQRPKSLKWYRNEINVLLNHAPLAGARLDELGDDLLAGFKSARLKQGRKISTVNSTIRVLRSALAHAVDDGLLAAKPKLKILPGAKHRDHVVRPDEEAKYLAVASEPLKSFATLLVGSGLLPTKRFACVGKISYGTQGGTARCRLRAARLRQLRVSCL